MNIKLGTMVVLAHDGKDSEFGLDWEETIYIESEEILDYILRNMKYVRLIK